MRRFMMVAFVFGATATWCSADVIYQTGFEAPTFTAGLPIEGQDGWITFTPHSADAGTITDTVAASGTQSLRIDGSLMNFRPGQDYKNAFYTKPLDFDPIASGLPLVEINIDARVDVGSEPGFESHFGYEIYDLNIEYLGQFGIYDEGQGLVARAYNHLGETVSGYGGMIVSSEFYTLTTRLNYHSLMMEFFINGSAIGSLAMPDYALGLVDVDPYVVDNGAGQFNSQIYFDNFRVTATVVPEPSSLVSAVLGAAALLGFRALRRKHRRAA